MYGNCNFRLVHQILLQTLGKGMPTLYYYSIWQAIMEVVVSTYRLSSMTIPKINYHSDSTTFFVLKNSMNNVMNSLEYSSDGIVNEIDTIQRYNNIVFIILLSVASFALLLSFVLIIPVLNRIKKNKQDVLELFMHIKKHSANEELNRCRKFLGNIQSVQETEYIVEEQMQDDQEEVDADTTIGRLKKMQKDNKIGRASCRERVSSPV